MKVLGILCECDFCFGGGANLHPCKGGIMYGRCTVCKRHYREHQWVEVDGVLYEPERVVHTGGRRAMWVYLEQGDGWEEVDVRLSARNVGTPILWGEEVARLPASVHGCWKRKKHQELVIVRRPKRVAEPQQVE